jgi:uncharacterized damage-inducible protein DinB
VNESGQLTKPLTRILQTKVEQQVERVLHLLSLVPHDKLEWRPVEGVFRIGDLLGHLLECLAGFCAVFYGANPDRLKHFSALKSKPVNYACSADEAKQRIDEYLNSIREGFELLTDEDLSRVIPSVFAQDGEPVLSMLLNNFEHLVNHKYQLFFYLRLLGIEASTRDLYIFLD